MCSVFGYIGKKNSRECVLEGLGRLEYRGYDSAGFACLSPENNHLLYAKTPGRLSNLQEQLEKTPIDGNVSIGHTRWSTHGLSSYENAHPHFDCEKTISLVHNGIVENHHELRKQLKNTGHTFHSETDTETVAHLFETLLKIHETFKGAIVDLVNQLDGAYALVVLMQEHPDMMLLIRKRSPLCIGLGNDEMFIASDQLAFAGKTKKVLFLPDQSFALVKYNTIDLYDFKGKPLKLDVQETDVDWKGYGKKGYTHFMLKEIYEQKGAIHDTIDFLHSLGPKIWDHVGLSAQRVKRLDKINLVACGTSWHASRIAQFFFERFCMIPTRVSLASEFRYMPFFPDRHTVYIMVSQSGETADTLEALHMIREFELSTIALTNVASSTIVREADGFLLTQAGQEVAVASTKAFSTQLTALYWLARRIAYEKKIINAAQFKTAEAHLLVAAELLENSIENYKRVIVHTLAKKYAQYKRYIFLGRHISYPFAMEAALKLKEISYIFAQCYPAGELKHGPIALIDEQTPVVLFSSQELIVYQKLVANAQEIKARNGHLIVFAFEGQDELCALADTVFVVPQVGPLLDPLVMTGLMQFFVYHIANELGRAIDKPRNLAKSVTVE
ncbi:glutamine--fructose-6-phosphate transaminase (isomerizing) [Candidatus Dependentiae bacterium]|nr:glutamine--fructose-6-phosphate transaminase (isomerizing) [Candidatus Dependentiae bacterium]